MPARSWNRRLPELPIACIGRAGQTARSLAAKAAGDSTISFVTGGRSEADLRDPASLVAFVERTKPHVLINAGAYNFVDRAETEIGEAMRINADGPRVLARRCRELGIGFIHMSTDCVFDGNKPEPYTEDDEALPLSAYGRSKLAGEKAVAEEYPDALTARVAWVFSEYGDNFVSKMIEFAGKRPVLKVVSDQIGPPTYAPDIAAALLHAAREKAAGASGLSGLLHIVSSDVLDRASMARAIMAESKRQGGPAAEIEGITTADFAAAAARPLNARLSNAKAVRRLGLTFTPWPEALRSSVAGVLARP
jgi:dTDP-4-dehydrorhamnose reductase